MHLFGHLIFGEKSEKLSKLLNDLFLKLPKMMFIDGKSNF